MDNFNIPLKATLDDKSIVSELEKTQKYFSKNLLKITPILNSSELENQIKDLCKSVVKSLSTTINLNLNNDDIYKGFQQLEKQSSIVVKNVKKDLNYVFKENILNISNGKSDELKNNFGKFSDFINVSNLFIESITAIKEGIRFVNNLDDALTNINYTMNISKSELKDLGKQSINMAKELGTGTENVLNAVTIYANADETPTDVLEKAKPTLMLSNVTGMDSSETADILQDTMSIFNMAEEELMHISDVMQKVSQNIAVDFSKGIKEISQGIQVSGNVAKDAGISFENYTALLGKMIEKTRMSGDETGNVLKTMLVRTTDASKAASSNGDVDTEDILKAESSLRSIGIEVRNDAENFRDFEDIMDDLYSKLNSISQVDMSKISYDVAGTKQTDQFRLMIESWGEYQQLVEQTTSADGTTLENQAKYAESLTASLNSFNGQAQILAEQLLDSDLLAWFVDVGTKLLEFLSIGDGLVATTTAVVLLLANIPRLIQGLGTIFNVAQIQAYISGLLAAGVAANGLIGVQLGLAAKIRIVTAELIKQAAAWLATPVGQAVAVIAAVGLAIGGLVVAYDNLAGAKEKAAIENLEQDNVNIKKYTDEIASLETLQSKLQSAKGNKVELAKIQGELNSVIGATPGLLNTEGTAFDVANTKLQDQINYKKQLLKTTQADKVRNSTELFDNKVLKRDWGFDGDSSIMRYYAQIYSSDMRFGIDPNIAFKSINASSGLSKEDWEKYWNSQVETAYDIFNDTIENYEEFGGQGFLKKVIDSSVREGFELEDVKNAVYKITDNSELQDFINQYYESLTNPNVDSDALYNNLKSSFDNLKQEMPHLSSAFDELFNSISAGSKSSVENIDNIKKSAFQSKSDIISSINDMSSGFEHLGKIYSDIKDKGSFDYGLLENKDFKDTFSKLGSDYTNFIETVSSSPNDIDKCQQSFNNLILTWIESDKVLKDLDTNNLDVAKNMLSNMGITNASEVVNNKFIKTLVKGKAATIDWSSKFDDGEISISELANSIVYTEDEMNALIAIHPELRNQFKKTDQGIYLEERAYGVLQESVYALKFATIESQKVQTQSVINSVTSRIQAYKIELSAIKNLASALSAISSNPISAGVFSSENYEDYLTMREDDIRLPALSREDYSQMKNQTTQVLQLGKAYDDLENISITTPKFNYGNDSSSGKGGGSSTQEKSKKEYDDFREYSDFYDELLSSKQNALDNYTTKNDAITTRFEKALADDDFYSGELLKSQLNNGLENAKNATSTYATELRDVLTNQIMPQIYDIAPELTGVNISEISDVQIEEVRQRLQNSINTQKNIDTDMQNQGNGDNSYNIKSAELMLDKWESLVSSAQSYYELVGSESGQGELSITWLELQSQILENNLLLQQKITDQYSKQIDSIKHKIELEENVYDMNEGSNFENIIDYYNQQKDIAHQSAENIRQELSNNPHSYSVEGINELESEIEGFQNIWWDADQAITDKFISQFDTRLSASNDWITSQEAADKLDVQGKKDAYNRIIAYTQEYLDELLKREDLSAEAKTELWKHCSDFIKKYQQNIYDIDKEIYQDSYDTIVDMIKDRYDTEKELADRNHNKKMKDLDAELEKINTVYNTIKSQYEDMYGEEDYQSKLYDLENAKNTIQSRIDALEGNDSDYATAQKIELKQQLVDKEKEISDLQREHERESTLDALDDDLKAQQDYLDEKKDAEDKSHTEYLETLSTTYNETNTHLMAMTALQTGYFETISANGTKSSETLTKAFSDFAENSGKKFDNLGLTFDDLMTKLSNVTQLLKDNPDLVAMMNGGSYTTSTTNKSIIDKMIDNSIAYNNTTDENVRNELHSENKSLGESIGATYNPDDGIWYKDGTPLYEIANTHTANTKLQKESILDKLLPQLLSPFDTTISGFNDVIKKLFPFNIPNISNYSPTSTTKVNDGAKITLSQVYNISGNANKKVLNAVNNELIKALEESSRNGLQ